MRDLEIKKYRKLNELAQSDGIVIFGEGTDTNIPLCELRQALGVDEKMYNRSFSELSINDAVNVFDTCISPIAPETVFIHIGESDITAFKGNHSNFDIEYRALIKHIREQNKKCRIAVISIKNTDNNPDVEEMNQHLKYIADSEKCEFGDLTVQKVWNPKATMQTSSFIRNMGFVHPIKTPKPLYDLIRILFSSEVYA